MKKYKVEITGTTPLLQNKPEEYGFDEQWIEKKATTDYEKQALKSLYVDDEGNVCQPATHIERALIESGKKIRMKGAGKSNYSKYMGSMIEVTPDLILHKIQNYQIHKALVVIPTTKGRIMRYRPMLKEWKLEFFITAEDEVSGQVIKEGLEIAGRFVGIGDWRPEKKGKFGKFQVTSFQEEE